MDKKEVLRKMMVEFNLVMRQEQMLEKYKWFSLASGIKDEEETKKLMKELLKEGIGNAR